MVAEDQPVCTICAAAGERIAVADRAGILVHVVDGRGDRMRREPRPHDATTDPQPVDGG